MHLTKQGQLSIFLKNFILIAHSSYKHNYKLSLYRHITIFPYRSAVLKSNIFNSWVARPVRGWVKTNGGSAGKNTLQLGSATLPTGQLSLYPFIKKTCSLSNDAFPWKHPPPFFFILLYLFSPFLFRAIFYFFVFFPSFCIIQFKRFFK